VPQISAFSIDHIRLN